MMERLAEQEVEAAAAEEDEAVKREHDRRLTAAMALLNQHNSDWFASEVEVGKRKEEGEEPPSTSSLRGSEDADPGHQRAVSSLGAGSTTGDERLDAAAAVARQRALAMAVLNEHNADWFGELDPTNKTAASRRGSRRSSLCESTVQPVTRRLVVVSWLCFEWRGCPLERPATLFPLSLNNFSLREKEKAFEVARRHGQKRKMTPQRQN